MIRKIFLTGLVFLVSAVMIDLSLLVPESVATLEPVAVNVSSEPVLPPKPIDINQMHCLATNIYHEARGESIKGKSAVAHVTMNRVTSNRYPNTVCEVVYQAEMRINWKGKLVPRLHKCNSHGTAMAKAITLF